MKKVTYFLLPFTFLILGVSCEKQELLECVKGKAIGYDRCSNVTLIQILSGSLKGDSIHLFGKEFENIVQYPNIPSSEEYPPLTVHGDSIFYFNYRFFDPEEDEYPFDDDVCPANIGPFKVPTIMITEYSTSNCPLSHEK